MTGSCADTFYWIALSLPGDAAYARAQQVTGDIVTTEEVLIEYLTFFSAASEYLRRGVAANVEAMLCDPGVRVIPQSHDSFLAGFELYRERPDKGYSMVDCILMQTMRKEGLTEASPMTGTSNKRVSARCSAIPEGSPFTRVQNGLTTKHTYFNPPPRVAPLPIQPALLAGLPAGYQLTLQATLP